MKNIEEKTGVSPFQFEKLAEIKRFTEQGKLKKGVKATNIINWLKGEYDIGRHATAIYAYINGKRT